MHANAGCASWAALLAARGVDVVALDDDPPSMAHHPVARGGAAALAGHADRALLLVGDADAATIGAYAGDAVVHVGARAELGPGWRLEATLDPVADLPTRPRPDVLTVWKRR